VPAAGLGIVALMIGAALTHLRMGASEYRMIPVNAVLLALAAIVAWGRLGPYRCRVIADLTDDEQRAWQGLLAVMLVGMPRIERTFREHGLVQVEYGLLVGLSRTPGGTAASRSRRSPTRGGTSSGRSRRGT
jgi:hypothetical protein